MDLMRDADFKNFLGNEKNKLVLSVFLSEILKMKYKYIYENIEYLNNNLLKNNIKDKTSICDILVKIKNKIINIEAYKIYNERKKMKNLNYISKLINKYYNSENNYKNKIEIIQINVIKLDREYEIYKIRSKKRIYTEKIEIINLHIDNSGSKMYTISKQSNIELWKNILNDFHFFVEYEKIIDKMKYKEETKNEIKERIKKYMSEEELREIGTTWEEHARFLALDERDEGIKIGKKEGKKESIISVALKMLEKNMNYKDISEITGLSIEKLEDLSNKININNKKIEV